MLENNNIFISKDASSSERPRSSSPGSSSSSPHPSGNMSDEGLILPKKLINPCLESKERLDLHRELMFNQKV
jgi:hypothetical protein